MTACGGRELFLQGGKWVGGGWQTNNEYVADNLIRPFEKYNGRPLKKRETKGTEKTSTQLALGTRVRLFIGAEIGLNPMEPYRGAGPSLASAEIVAMRPCQWRRWRGALKLRDAASRVAIGHRQGVQFGLLNIRNMALCL